MALDDKRLGELHDVSRAARDARSRISLSLKQAQDAEAKRRSDYGSLKENIRNGRFLVSPTNSCMEIWAFKHVWRSLMFLPSASCHGVEVCFGPSSFCSLCSS
jgi:hypothetical protein